MKRDEIIDNVIEVILGDVDCFHTQDLPEGGIYSESEYSLNNEAKVRGKIEALIKPEITEKWIGEKATELKEGLFGIKMDFDNRKRFWAIKDFIHSLIGELPITVDTK